MNETIIITGADNLRIVRWITLRSALKLEIQTGMKRSNRGRSTLALVNEITGHDDKRKLAAYNRLNSKIVEAGGQDKPLPA
jgi:hypothetical protein